MKTKIFIIAALITLFGTQTYSQSIAVGLIAGVNIANVKFTPKLATSPDSRTGAVIGGLIDIGISSNIAIETGLEYVMKGAEATSGGVTEKLKLDYLEFPALVKVKIPMTEVNPYVLAGLTLGVNLSAKAEDDNGQTSQEVDIKDNIESSDFGLFFGAGLNFRVATKTSLFVQGGYSLGLTDINKVASATEVKNYGIQLGAGVMINLK